MRRTSVLKATACTPWSLYVNSVTVERWRMWSIGWSGAQPGLDIVRHYWNNIMIIPPILMKIPRTARIPCLACHNHKQQWLFTLCGRRVLAHSTGLNSLYPTSPWLNCKLNCILYMWRTHYLNQQLFCFVFGEYVGCLCIVLPWASLCPSGAVWHDALKYWLIDWYMYIYIRI